MIGPVAKRAGSAPVSSKSARSGIHVAHESKIRPERRTEKIDGGIRAGKAGSGV
jgi:hypothetical protein